MKKNVGIILFICLLLGLLTGCGNSYTASDLRDAQKRYYSGQYTREDERMVEGFNKWKREKDKYID